MGSTQRAFGFVMVVLLATGALVLFTVSAGGRDERERFVGVTESSTEDGRRVEEGFTALIDQESEAPRRRSPYEELFLAPGAERLPDAVELERLRRRRQRDRPGTEWYVKVPVRDGDTWRKLAWRWMRDGRDWKNLRSANNERWRGPRELDTVREIMVPVSLLRR